MKKIWKKIEKDKSMMFDDICKLLIDLNKRLKKLEEDLK